MDIILENYKTALYQQNYNNLNKAFIAVKPTAQ